MLFRKYLDARDFAISMYNANNHIYYDNAHMMDRSIKESCDYANIKITFFTLKIISFLIKIKREVKE